MGSGCPKGKLDLLAIAIDRRCGLGGIRVALVAPLPRDAAFAEIHTVTATITILCDLSWECEALLHYVTGYAAATGVISALYFAVEYTPKHDHEAHLYYKTSARYTFHWSALTCCIFGKGS